MRYIDSHTHMDHKRFTSNRADIIEQAHDDGIEYMINPAISFESCFEMNKILSKYDYIKYAIGIHPKYVGTDNMLDEEWEKGLLRLLLFKEKYPKIVGIGETGLDFFALSRDENGDLDENSVITIQRQKLYFRKQLQLAGMFKLPLILHIRCADVETLKLKYDKNADELDYVDAHKEAVELLKEFDSILLPEYKGVVHCFTSDEYTDAKNYIDMGYLIGVGGAFTKDENKALREVIREIPIEKIVLETDSPFVLPEGMPADRPFAGKRNTPLSIPYIAERLADLKGITVEEVASITTENAKRLFRL